jgi:hypothetical protein
MENGELRRENENSKSTINNLQPTIIIEPNRQ